MFPSKHPVRKTLSPNGKMQSIDEGCPGKRSEIFPHSSLLKISTTPSPVPHTTFLSPFKKHKFQPLKKTHFKN